MHLPPTTSTAPNRPALWPAPGPGDRQPAASPAASCRPQPRQPPQRSRRRLPALAFLAALAGVAAGTPAWGQGASVSATMQPYWRVPAGGLQYYYERATVTLFNQPGSATVSLFPTSLTPPAPTWQPVAEGWAAARADVASGSLGAGAEIDYIDTGGSAGSSATIHSGDATWSGGRLVFMNAGIAYQYLGRLQLTLHGQLQGIARGGVTLGGRNVAEGSLGIRNDGFGSAQASCGFASGGPRCTERSQANLSGDRFYTQATWSGAVGPSFGLTMDMPLLVDPSRPNFTLQMNLFADAFVSEGWLSGSSINMMNTSTLRFLPEAGATVQFGDPLFLSAVPEPGSAALAAAGVLLVLAAARRRRAAPALSAAAPG